MLLPKWKYAEDFSEGFAVVGNPNGPFSYIDHDGNRAIRGEFAAASPFFKGLAQVRLLLVDSKEAKATFAYIDSKGRRVFTY